MQVSNIIIAVTAEVFLVTLIVSAVLFIHNRRLKALIRRQQAALTALLPHPAHESADSQPLTENSPHAAPQTRNYKTYINEALDATVTQFSQHAPAQDIVLTAPEHSTLPQQILALRYAFLRAEELGTTEDIGTDAYWNVFEQALAPLLINQNDAQHDLVTMIQTPSSPPAHTSINITRQDPRAADEIAKLHNIAADQYRTIHELQQKLMSAITAEQKELAIQAIQQQLERQIRFVHESETCIQLLEDELTKAHAEILLQDQSLNETSALHEENQHIKNALHSFTLESKGLINNIQTLENENDELKRNKMQP